MTTQRKRVLAAGSSLQKGRDIRTIQRAGHIVFLLIKQLKNKAILDSLVRRAIFTPYCAATSGRRPERSRLREFAHALCAPLSFHHRQGERVCDGDAAARGNPRTTGSAPSHHTECCRHSSTALQLERRPTRHGVQANVGMVFTVTTPSASAQPQASNLAKPISSATRIAKAVGQVRSLHMRDRLGRSPPSVAS